MRHLLLNLCYRGTAYHGYQVQANARTVAETVQDGVARVFGVRLDVKGCSRTDTGVHANAFALTLRTDSTIDCAAVVRAMNVNLPQDITVQSCFEVPEDFHPRYSCQGKRYVYRILNRPLRDAFAPDLALHHPHSLDIGAMNAAALHFLGTHDFAAFCSSGSSVQDTVRTMTAASVTRAGDLVTFSVTGDGFLYNMVRIMTGTLLDVARGAIAPAAVADILGAGERSAAGATAPPHGLYLDAVFYDGFTVEQI